MLAEALSAIKSASSIKDLDDIRIQHLSRKGRITSVLKSLKDLPLEKRKEIGAAANKARVTLEQSLKDGLERIRAARPTIAVDPTLPGIRHRVGAIHPLTSVMNRLCEGFIRMGFGVAKGPDLETDYYNFEALNFPPDHPARDMQDTFYVEGGKLLRTHTTPVQVRILEMQKPPVKVIMPGKTYRNETVSARAHCIFHQVDGFLVDEGVTMADLKGALFAFCRYFFGEDVKVKFRTSFFPFTEPSAELDITCFLCKGKGCALCKYSGWLEILGCGMIDPFVLSNVGLDSEKYTGYAFGIGVERIAMLKYGITDIRLFFENDIRFIRQFK
ncbi:MAG: phenylalanine--tRNA ligase subunit alpha [Candidatus Zixiibacteriota bacterium]|nr:MAG: phenylalanine--tRNA ligase subunit alpha [candidate division Zixibacteria bacterium]